MRLSSEEIFALHILVGVTTFGVSKLSNKVSSGEDKINDFISGMNTEYTK